MINEVRLYACSKFYREEDQLFTDNPIKEIHTLCPKKIVIDTAYFNGEILALYINCLCNEDYVLDYKRAMVKEEDGSGNAIYGFAVYLKRKPESECKMRTDKLRKEDDDWGDYQH
jgi:hypothetical protein